MRTTKKKTRPVTHSWAKSVCLVTDHKCPGAFGAANPLLTSTETKKVTSQTRYPFVPLNVAKIQFCGDQLEANKGKGPKLPLRSSLRRPNWVNNASFCPRAYSEFLTTKTILVLGEKATPPPKKNKTSKNFGRPGDFRLFRCHTMGCAFWN